MKREIVGSTRYSLVRANTHGCRARRGSRSGRGWRRYFPRVDVSDLFRSRIDVSDFLRMWRW